MFSLLHRNAFTQSTRNLSLTLIRFLNGIPLPLFKSSDIDLMNGEEFSASRPLKSASALIPIVERDDSANVIFTRRTATARHHAGQISFPGGRKEDQDRGPAATALREAQEEIGLDPRNVDWFPDHAGRRMRGV